MKFVYIILFLFFLFSFELKSENDSLIIAPADTAALQVNRNTPQSVDEYDDSPLLTAIAFVMVVAVCFFIGVGIVVTALFLLSVFALTAGGILSASVLVGFYQKSFLSGFKIFIRLGALAVSLIFSITTIVILNRVLHWWSFKIALSVGLVSGLLSGLVFGWVVIILIRKLSEFFCTKLKL